MPRQEVLETCRKRGFCIELSNRGKIDEDLSSIFNSIREASKVISKLVNTAPLKQVWPT